MFILQCHQLKHCQNSSTEILDQLHGRDARVQHPDTIATDVVELEDIVEHLVSQDAVEVELGLSVSRRVTKNVDDVPDKN